MEKIIELLYKEISKDNLYDLVKGVSNFHRIQASPGFRESANYCKNKLLSYGVDAKILSYPFDGKKWYLMQKSFKEWSINKATLNISYPVNEKLCDFDLIPTSVVQKSYPVNLKNIDVVEMVSNNLDLYKDIDLENKILFIHEKPAGYLDFISKKKALGFISDEMPRRDIDKYKLMNSYTYMSFWWDDEDLKTFGFVISPLQGKYLKKLIDEQAKKHEENNLEPKYIKVDPYIDSKLYDGALEVVEAKVEGDSDDVILMCAHLCHPKPSCNDNASGVSCGIEAFRTIKKLKDLGKIKLSKTIKLILVPEMTGTYCYLSSVDTSKIKACINLDMVGGRQNGDYGPITLTKLPYANASFTGDLNTLLMDLCASRLSKDNIFINYKIEEYSGGSDHIIFSDPTINIPCLMLGQWPDLNYHLFTDNIEVIDKNVIGYSCLVGASFMLTLAMINDSFLPLIFNSSYKNINKRIEELLLKLNEKIITKEVFLISVKRLHKYYLETLESLYLYFNDIKMIKRQKYYLNNYFNNLIEYYKDIYNIKEEKTLDTNVVYKRLYKSPINDLAHVASLYKKINEYNLFKQCLIKNKIHPYFSNLDLVEMYINGKNSINTIINNILADKLSVNEDVIYAYIKLLLALNLIEEVK